VEAAYAKADAEPEAGEDDHGDQGCSGTLGPFAEMPRMTASVVSLPLMEIQAAYGT
jgi:hypothetical protein